LVFRAFDKSRGALIEDVAGEYQVPSGEIKVILERFGTDDGKLKALELLLKVPRDRAKDVLDRVKDAAPAVRQMYRQRSRYSFTVGGCGILFALVALLLPSGSLPQTIKGPGPVATHNGDHGTAPSQGNPNPKEKNRESAKQPPPPVLSEARISFHTTDDDKDGDTRVTTLVEFGGSTIASAAGEFGHWADNSDSGWIKLAVNDRRRKSELLGAGVLKIMEAPKGHDEWHFNYVLELIFSDDDVKRFDGSGNVDYDRTTVTKSL
jgi:hypothetical protein